MTRTRDILALIVLVAFCALVAALNLGCQGKGTSAPSVTGNAASEARVRVGWMRDTFETVGRKAPGVREIAEEGKKQADLTLDNLDTVTSSSAATARTLRQREDEALSLKRDLDAERAQWFSDRQHRLFFWLTAAAGLGVALCCVGLIAPGGWYKLAAMVGRVLIYASVVYAPLAWLFDHVWLRKVQARAIVPELTL